MRITWKKRMLSLALCLLMVFPLIDWKPIEGKAHGFWDDNYHIHTPACYPDYKISCGIEQGSETNHVHSLECFTYDDSKGPICGLEEGPIEDKELYTQNHVGYFLSCEIEEHIHSDSCYTWKQVIKRESTGDTPPTNGSVEDPVEDSNTESPSIDGPIEDPIEDTNEEPNDIQSPSTEESTDEFIEEPVEEPSTVTEDTPSTEEPSIVTEGTDSAQESAEPSEVLEDDNPLTGDLEALEEPEESPETPPSTDGYIEVTEDTEDTEDTENDQTVTPSTEKPTETLENSIENNSETSQEPQPITPPTQAEQATPEPDIDSIVADLESPEYPAFVTETIYEDEVPEDAIYGTGEYESLIRGTLLCTKEEHTHTYEDCPTRELTEWRKVYHRHHHTFACYDTYHTVCGLDEDESHYHTLDCYEGEGKLLCGMDENDIHQHITEIEEDFEEFPEFFCTPCETILICKEDHEHTKPCFEEIYSCRALDLDVSTMSDKVVVEENDYFRLEWQWNEKDALVSADGVKITKTSDKFAYNYSNSGCYYYFGNFTIDIKQDMPVGKLVLNLPSYTTVQDLPLKLTYSLQGFSPTYYKGPYDYSSSNYNVFAFDNFYYGDIKDKESRLVGQFFYNNMEFSKGTHISIPIEIRAGAAYHVWYNNFIDIKYGVGYFDDINSLLILDTKLCYNFEHVNFGTTKSDSCNSACPDYQGKGHRIYLYTDELNDIFKIKKEEFNDIYLGGDYIYFRYDKWLYNFCSLSATRKLNISFKNNDLHGEVISVSAGSKVNLISEGNGWFSFPQTELDDGESFPTYSDKLQGMTQAEFSILFRYPISDFPELNNETQLKDTVSIIDRFYFNDVNRVQEYEEVEVSHNISAYCVVDRYTGELLDQDARYASSNSNIIGNLYIRKLGTPDTMIEPYTFYTRLRNTLRGDNGDTYYPLIASLDYIYSPLTEELLSYDVYNIDYIYVSISDLDTPVFSDGSFDTDFSKEKETFKVYTLSGENKEYEFFGNFSEGKVFLPENVHAILIVYNSKYNTCINMDVGVKWNMTVPLFDRKYLRDFLVITGAHWLYEDGSNPAFIPAINKEGTSNSSQGLFGSFIGDMYGYEEQRYENLKGSDGTYGMMYRRVYTISIFLQLPTLAYLSVYPELITIGDTHNKIPMSYSFTIAPKIEATSIEFLETYPDAKKLQCILWIPDCIDNIRVEDRLCTVNNTDTGGSSVKVCERLFGKPANGDWGDVNGTYPSKHFPLISDASITSMQITTCSSGGKYVYLTTNIEDIKNLSEFAFYLRGDIMNISSGVNKRSTVLLRFLDNEDNILNAFDSNYRFSEQAYAHRYYSEVMRGITTVGELPCSFNINIPAVSSTTGVNSSFKEGGTVSTDLRIEPNESYDYYLTYINDEGLSNNVCIFSNIRDLHEKKLIKDLRFVESNLDVNIYYSKTLMNFDDYLSNGYNRSRVLSGDDGWELLSGDIIPEGATALAFDYGESKEFEKGDIASIKLNAIAPLLEAEGDVSCYYSDYHIATNSWATLAGNTCHLEVLCYYSNTQRKSIGVHDSSGYVTSYDVNLSYPSLVGKHGTHHPTFDYILWWKSYSNYTNVIIADDINTQRKDFDIDVSGGTIKLSKAYSSFSFRDITGDYIPKVYIKSEFIGYDNLKEKYAENSYTSIPGLYECNLTEGIEEGTWTFTVPSDIVVKSILVDFSGMVFHSYSEIEVTLNCSVADNVHLESNTEYKNINSFFYGYSWCGSNTVNGAFTIPDTYSCGTSNSVNAIIQDTIEDRTVSKSVTDNPIEGYLSANTSTGDTKGDITYKGTYGDKVRYSYRVTLDKTFITKGDTEVDIVDYLERYTPEGENDFFGRLVGVDVSGLKEIHDGVYPLMGLLEYYIGWDNSINQPIEKVQSKLPIGVSDKWDTPYEDTSTIDNITGIHIFYYFSEDAEYAGEDVLKDVHLTSNPYFDLIMEYDIEDLPADGSHLFAYNKALVTNHRYYSERTYETNTTIVEIIPDDPVYLPFAGGTTTLPVYTIGTTLILGSWLAIKKKKELEEMFS